MQKQHLIYPIVFILSLGATGAVAETDCGSDSGAEKIVGGALGAALGGLLGSKFGSGSGKTVAIGTGVVIGGLLGSHIAASLTCADQHMHQAAARRALEDEPVGTPSTWDNPESGNSGEVVAVNEYQQSDGTNCRQFEQTITTDKGTEESVRTACRQADGGWKIVG